LTSDMRSHFSNEKRDSYCKICDVARDGLTVVRPVVSSRPAWFGRYRRLEASCDLLFAFDPFVVHGLLQAEEYTRCAVVADGETDSYEIRRRLDERLERKLDAFGRRGKRVSAVFGAAALRPGFAPPEVTSRQVRYLRAMAVPGDVDIRVLPGDAPCGAFTILETGDAAVVYLEADGAATYLEGAAVEPYRTWATELRRAAVPVRRWAIPAGEADEPVGC
jgi:hypothetical protein